MRYAFARNPVLIGIVMAAIFLAVETTTAAYVAYETVVIIFAICVFVVCAALVDTPMEGLICGFIVLAAQNGGTFLRDVLAIGPNIAAILLQYSLVLSSTYLITGTIGGYFGRRLASSPPVTARRKRERQGPADRFSRDESKPRRRA